MKHKKKFRTIIISRKTLSMIIMCIAAGIIISTVFFFTKIIISKAAEDTSDLEQVYKFALENELPGNKIENSRTLSEKILGFNLFDPKTILLAGSIFTHIDHDYISESAGAENTEIADNKSENSEIEKKIENVQISKGMNVSNATEYEIDAVSMANEPLGFTIDSSGPQILIVHTHTTESYTSDDRNTYNPSESDRSTDPDKNMIAVGNRICEVLNNAGIKTIHDTTVHDYPSYNGAYGRSLATVEKNLKENPSIKAVLDVHRDGLVRADGTKLKVTADIGGITTAQVMLVIGTNSSGLKHDNWRSNMVFASKIQKKANDMYPNMMRPLNLRVERFNQHMTAGSLIIEVGSNGNTLNEALLAAENIAAVISAVVKE